MQWIKVVLLLKENHEERERPMVEQERTQVVKEEILLEEDTHGIPDHSYEVVLCGLR